MPELFAEQVRRSPDAIALREGEAAWTYRDLDGRAARLAHELIALGVGPGQRVALLVERSPAAIWAQLAVLMAGAAYVPLDPGSPAERIARLVESCRPAAVVAAGSHLARVGLQSWSCPTLRPDAELPGPDAVAAPEIRAAATDPAYVMYTSGSTGQPKGVVVPHRAIVRLVRNTDFADLGPDQVFLQLAPLAFDASTLEIWGPLLNGGQLVIAPPQASLREIGEAVRRHGVTTLWLTAGLFHLMVEEGLEALAGLRQLLAGGDVLSPPHVRKALQALPGCRLINGYGPTENTTFTCCYTIPRDPPPLGPIPIGFPIANTQAHILDAQLRPVPDGEEGQLCAGGDGVALGYLDRPDLSAERFVPDPFSDEPGARLYLTGDLVRRGPDGALRFLGRLDTQVKIDGKRVELEEIEAALRECPGVVDAAVAVHAAPGGAKQVNAYVVPSAAAPAVAAVRAGLARLLPAHMIPAGLTLVPALPLNANGKVDRGALPRLHGSRSGSARSFVPPRSEEERLVAQVWRSLLEVEEVGIDDNFFDLGGTSLKLLAVHRALAQASGVDLPVTDLFAKPTVRALAERLREGERAGLDIAASRARAARQGEALRRLRRNRLE